MELTYAWFLLTAALLFLIQQHHAYASSVLQGPTAEERSSLAQLAHTVQQRRVKRCSCESHKDKECVYFCHIGIVWVNTPDQVVPYGVGSVNIRVRRELDRCRCSNTHDVACEHFCSALQTHTQGENGSVEGKTAKQRKKHKSAFWPTRHRHSLNKHQT